MGYTHYWDGKVECSLADWLQAKEEFFQVAVASGIPLAGGDGTGMPEWNNTEVCFNGRDRDAYETFHIRKGQGGFGFTKTAHRSYDTLVCAALVILKRYCPTMEVSSDGGEDDWAEGIKLCQDTLGYGSFPCGEGVVVAPPKPREPEPTPITEADLAKPVAPRRIRGEGIPND